MRGFQIEQAENGWVLIEEANHTEGTSMRYWVAHDPDELAAVLKNLAPVG